MLKKIIINTFLILAISLFSIINDKVLSDPKDPRFAHSSVLIGNKFYIVGGNIPLSSSNDIFYIDVSKSFNVTSIPITDLTSKAPIPLNNSQSTVSYGGADGSLICLFGGVLYN